MQNSKYNQNLLKDAHQKSEVWIENSPICTKIVDCDFNLQFMSKAGYEALQIADITEYYGKPYPLEFYPESFKEEMLDTIISAKDSGETVMQEASVVDLHGNEVWFHSTVVPIYNEDKMLDYFMIVSIDTTDRKSAEIKLKQMNDDLESLVASRTRELEEVNKQLKLSSETDFLTKIPNRRFYEQRLDENIAMSKRKKTELSMLMIDIDRFKEYNDTYGHDAGDGVLYKIATSIKNSLRRSTELVARYGGEEFVVLLPSTNSEGAFMVAEKIRKNIENLKIEHKNSHSGLVTVSLGVEALNGAMLNSSDLFKHADLALYAAKDKGRNCSCIYSGSNL